MLKYDCSLMCFKPCVALDPFDLSELTAEGWLCNKGGTAAGNEALRMTY